MRPCSAAAAPRELEHGYRPFHFRSRLLSTEMRHFNPQRVRPEVSDPHSTAAFDSGGDSDKVVGRRPESGRVGLAGDARHH